MHECKKCGEKFENMGLLLAHYKEHKREEEEEEEREIPVEWCPSETKLLGEGRTVGLKILGIKKGNKIVINDVYLL